MLTYWSAHPLRLGETLLPFTLHELPLNQTRRQTLLEGREPFVLSVYLGMPTLGLVMGAFSGPSHMPRKLLAIFGVAAAVLALGRHGLAYDLAVGLVPPLGMLRYPEKVLIVAAFVWALLAGAGVDAWRRTDRESRAWTLWTGAALLGLAAVAGAGAMLAAYWPAVWGWLLDLEASGRFISQGLSQTTRRLATTTGLTTACAVAWLWRWRSPGRAGGLTLLAVALAVLDLALVNGRLNPTGPKQLFTQPPPTLKDLDQPDHRRVYVTEYSLVPGKAQRLLGREQAFMLSGHLPGWPPRVSAVMASRMYLLPPITAAWQLEGSYDVDLRGLYPPHLARLAQAGRALETTSAHLRLLRLGAVGRVVSLHNAGFESLEAVATHPGLYVDPIQVLRVPGALPRTYVVGTSRIADGMAALETLIEPTFDPKREVVLSEGVARRATPRFAGSSRILELRPDQVRIEATVSETGYVVLVDAHDQGWQARVDGQPVPLLRANVAFRAVELTRGRHLVELRYRPAAVSLGLVIGLGGLLLGTALGFGWVPGLGARA
jgi:hypothetical protein